MMNSVGPNGYTTNEKEADYYKEISHKVKKCAEENIGKLKEAKNLEDLVKIKLSTVNVVQNDKNSYWRNLINKELMREQEIKNASLKKNQNAEPESSTPEIMEVDEQNK